MTTLTIDGVTYTLTPVPTDDARDDARKQDVPEHIVARSERNRERAATAPKRVQAQVAKLAAKLLADGMDAGDVRKRARVLGRDLGLEAPIARAVAADAVRKARA